MKTKPAETKQKGSTMFIWFLKNGQRFTTDRDIAVRVARETKKAPIEFISPKLRDAYLRAWPELGKIFGE